MTLCAKSQPLLERWKNATPHPRNPKFIEPVRREMISELSYDLWARTAKPEDFPKIYFANKDAGSLKNFAEFEETVNRAERRPELIWFKEEALKVWEVA